MHCLKGLYNIVCWVTYCIICLDSAVVVVGRLWCKGDFHLRGPSGFRPPPDPMLSAGMCEDTDGSHCGLVARKASLSPVETSCDQSVSLFYEQPFSEAHAVGNMRHAWLAAHQACHGLRIHGSQMLKAEEGRLLPMQTHEAHDAIGQDPKFV